MRAVTLGDGVSVRHDYPKAGQPRLPEGEALVRVRKAGICNTDLELIQGYAGHRGVLGHEFVGVVEACPADSRWVGKRVVGEINVACGTCATCRAGRRSHCPSRTALGIRGRDGAFADYLTLPAENLHAVPDSVSDDAAVFVEPLAAALAITDQLHVRPTARVMVLGDGKLGQLIAQVLALTGCALTAVGHHEGKLALLGERGIDTLLVARSSQPPDLQVDIVVEATGTATGFATAQRLVRPRGQLVLKSTYHGLAEVDLTQVVVEETSVTGSRCGPFPPALRMLAQGMVDVESLIEARYSLDQAPLALEKAAAKGALKILLEISDG